MYKIKREIYFNKYVGFYFAYAVIYKDTNGKILKISDVFRSKKKAVEFIRICNLLSLDPIHLEDVLEDYLQ